MWVNATPEKAPLPRRLSLQAARERGEDVPELDPPELDFELEYLFGYFYEVGPLSQGEEITWAELVKWQEATGAKLDSFECAALRNMSQAYLGMQHEARKPNCPCPGRRKEATEEQKAAANERLKQGLIAMAESRKRPPRRSKK